MGEQDRPLTSAEQAVLRRLRGVYKDLAGVVEERDKFEVAVGHRGPGTAMARVFTRLPSSAAA